MSDVNAAPPHERPREADRRAAPRHPADRRHRLLGRALPLGLIGLVAAVAGAVVGAAHVPADRAAAQRYAQAWAHGSYRAMYGLLSAQSRAHVSRARFVAAYRQAALVATLERVAVAGRVRRTADERFVVPMRAVTRRFGVVSADLTLDVDAGSGGAPAGVRFERRSTFPGLRPGERLSSRIMLTPRAALLARDGQVIASGPERSSQIGTIAAEIAGHVGPIPADQRTAYAERGYPPDALVGLTGLERQFETRLAGTFGGVLRAGRRTLASTVPRAGGPVRTSIDVGAEQAAVTALAGRYGGIAVLRPRTGEVLALAGIAYSAPQPPGSTFKIVTLSAALDAGVVHPHDTFPVEGYAVLDGVKLENANGESCGGSLETSFADSCNSVFAPIGAKLGARRLVAAAERFGFNAPSDVPGGPSGSIPAPPELGDSPLALGSTAIGQGRVTATPLRMAEVAGAIANRGRLVRPVFLRGAQGRTSRATSPHTAHVVRRFMRAVVASGTGAAAGIPGVDVVGKTGTAELRDTVPDPTAVANGTPAPNPTDTTDTDAWFVGFAPARHPQAVVAVMLVGAGAGGATAAPAARTVLEGVLKGS
jgi:beta-lactamase class D